MPDPYLKSLLFDSRLIELGEWPEEHRSKINEWNETGDYELQRNKAASLMRYLIVKILEKDCSSSGKIRIKRLGQSLANLEQILISTRELEKKFYRDHLNHIIRVALLARAIGRKRPFNLASEDLDMLVIASLFHDVAYPLSKIGQSFSFAINAVKNCYNIASKISPVSELKLNLDSNKISISLSIDKEVIKNKLKELDHGFLSSIELMSYLKQDSIERYLDVIRSIAFHSPSFDFEIEASSEKILALLVLADELQDWGRPSGSLAYLCFVPKIEKLKIADNMMSVEYDTKGIPGYSLMRQIYSKATNLTRIRLPNDFSFNLKFSFDNFREINLKNLDNNLQSLFNRSSELEQSLFSPIIFTKLYENSTFEKIFYGKSIPKEIKMQLLNLLNSKKLCKSSPLIDFRVFMNDSIKDLLVVSDQVSTPIENFQFCSFPSGQIKLEIVSKDGIFEGKIKTIFNKTVSKISLFLLSEIRFINICVQKIAKFRNNDYPVEVGYEDFPSKEDISCIIREMGDATLHETFDLLFKIRDCISNDGFFLFNNSDFSKEGTKVGFPSMKMKDC